MVALPTFRTVSFPSVQASLPSLRKVFLVGHLHNRPPVVESSNLTILSLPNDIN